MGTEAKKILWIMNTPLPGIMDQLTLRYLVLYTGRGDYTFSSSSQRNSYVCYEIRQRNRN